MSRSGGRGGNAGIKIDLIRDEATQTRFKQVAKLKDRLNELRVELRKGQDEKEKNMRTFEPVREKFTDSSSGEIDALMERKDVLHRKIDEIRIRQNSASQMRDELRMVDFEISPLQKAVFEASDKVKEVQAQLAKLEAQRAAMTPAYKNLTEADQAISRIDQQLAAATKSNNTKQMTQLAKQKTEAERAKAEVQQSYTLDDKIIATRRRLEHATNELEKKTELRAEAEAKRKSLREKLDGGNDVRKDFDKLRDELTAVMKQLDAARAKRREKRPVNEDLKTINESLAKLRAERDEIQKQLDELNGSAPHFVVKFDPECRGDIIGRGGATLEQLQLDFGVAIDIDGDTPGVLEIIGGAEDAKACQAAIEAIVEQSKNSRQKATVKFDPALIKPFIGAKGSNIERLQTTSGAQIRLSDNKEEITLTGTAEAIEIAKKLIDEFMFNSASAELTFDVGIREFIIGKAGAVIRRIEKESGVKRINVSAETGTISISGNKDAVEKAKAMYEDIIVGMSSNAFTMRADDRMTRVVIGKGGETIRNIQETTGAAINVARGVITIRGSKDAVEGARRMIEDVARRDEVKVPYDVHLHAFLTTRPLVVMDADEDGNKQQDVEGDCPLELVRQQAGCDRVSAIRAEQKILIVGKRESVNQARALLEELFRTNRPHVTRVAFPDVLRGYLTKRAGAAGSKDRLSPLDKIKLEHPGIVACDLNRETSMVEIAGGADAVKAGASALEAIIAEFQPFIRTIKFPQRLVGSIIGSGGKNIADLTTRTKTEIRVDKERFEVTALSVEKNVAQLDEVEKAIEAIKTAGSSPSE